MTCREGHAPKYPDFEPGNLEHLVHGAESPRVVQALARIVQDEVVERAPWLEEPVFADALERYARAEARARLLTAHILKVADEQGAGKLPVRIWEGAVASDNAASRMAEQLGLTPLARAKLAALASGAEVSQANLEQLAERGRVIRERRSIALEVES